MAATFTHLLLDGVPECLCKGVIHPIFKAGAKDDPNNYRGITVTPVLSKLFAMILEACLSEWASARDIGLWTMCTRYVLSSPKPKEAKPNPKP